MNGRRPPIATLSAVEAVQAGDNAWITRFRWRDAGAAGPHPHRLAQHLGGANPESAVRSGETAGRA
jgi:hypothetical protein